MTSRAMTREESCAGCRPRCLLTCSKPLPPYLYPSSRCITSSRDIRYHPSFSPVAVVSPPHHPPSTALNNASSIMCICNHILLSSFYRACLILSISKSTLFLFQHCLADCRLFFPSSARMCCLLFSTLIYRIDRIWSQSYFAAFPHQLTVVVKISFRNRMLYYPLLLHITVFPN